MIECDPNAGVTIANSCTEIAASQKELIRETIPLVVLAGVALVFKSRVRHD